MKKFALSEDLRAKLDAIKNESLTSKIAIIQAAQMFRKGDWRNIDPDILAGIDAIIEEDERMRRNEKKRK